MKITETPVFLNALAQDKRVEVPMLTVIRDHLRSLVLGTLIAVANFVLFYLLTVFCLSWGTDHLHYNRNQFLVIQLVGVLFFGAMIPCSAAIADRYGRRATLIAASLCIIVFGFAFGPLMSSGTSGVMVNLIIGFSLVGMTYGPLGTLLSELYPTAVRYTGSSASFTMAGILGASLAPYLATSLALKYGLSTVGFYLSAAALVSLIAVALAPETQHKVFGMNEPA